MSISRDVRGFVKRFPTFLLAAGIATGVFAQDQVAMAANVELKIATLAPDGSTWMKEMRALDTEVRAKTNGEVGLRFYPGGIQGSEDVVLRKIRSGQLHGAGFTGVGLGQIAPSLRVLELPFLFENSDEVHAVHAKLDPLFEEKLQAGGYTLLGWSEVGFVHVYSKDPITTAAQLCSAKVWLWEGDPLAEAFLKAVGVSPIPLDVTDVMTSLQTGLVNTVYVSPLACIALQWFTRVGYVTDLPLTHGLGAVVVTNEAWGKIPPAHQPVVRELCEHYFERLRVATVVDNEKSAVVISESGVKTVAPAAADAAEFRALGAKVAEELVGKLYDQAMLDEVRREVVSARAAAPGGAK